MNKFCKNEEYILDIIHDIKAPVLSMDFALKNANKDEFLNEIYLINRHNLNYIENMLANYSLDKGKYCIQPEIINLNEIVKEEIEALNLLIQEKRLRIIISSDKSKNCYIVSDKNIVRQIILNLITNAVKYAPLNSAISVIFEHKEGCLNICFKNSLQNKNCASSTKMGLEIIKKRLKAIKGRFNLTKNEEEICLNICFDD